MSKASYLPGSGFLTRPRRLAAQQWTQLATNVKKPLSLHPWALRILFGLVQNKFPWRTTSIQKRQNECSEVVFPFNYECGCLMMTHCPTNSGGGIGSHFSDLPDSSVYPRTVLVQYLSWRHSKSTSAWRSGQSLGRGPACTPAGGVGGESTEGHVPAECQHLENHRSQSLTNFTRKF